MKMERRDRNNLRFYVAMQAAMTLVGVPKQRAREIAAITADQISDDLLLQSLASVDAIYRELGDTDQVAKGTELGKRFAGAFGTQPTLIQ
jgi:hypothetical protein